MSPATRVLSRILNRERIGLVVVVFVFIGFAIAIDVPEWAWARRRINMSAPPGGVVWLLRVLALGLALGGLWAVSKLRSFFPLAAHPVWKLLVETPGDVVWVHSGLETEYRAYGMTVNTQRSVFLLTVDRERNNRVETYSEWAEELERALEDELPRASFGFSQERMKQYLAEPRSLYRK